MKISGIIFDKDGTLLDFNEFWIPAAQCVIRRILSDYKIPVTFFVIESPSPVPPTSLERALSTRKKRSILSELYKITCFLTVHSRGKHFWIWRLT